jgi:hypothetical protein
LCAWTTTTSKKRVKAREGKRAALFKNEFCVLCVSVLLHHPKAVTHSLGTENRGEEKKKKKKRARFL